MATFNAADWSTGSYVFAATPGTLTIVKFMACLEDPPVIAVAKLDSRTLKRLPSRQRGR